MIINPKKVINQFLIDITKAEQLQINGVDLTVEDVFTIGGTAVIRQDKKELPEYCKVKSEINLNNRETWHLIGNRPYLLQIAETVKIPDNAMALVFMRSTFNRVGCPIFATVFDSGYEGKPTLTIYPHINLYLEKGTRVAQIVYFEAEANGVYDGQYQRENINKEKEIQVVN